MAQIMGKYLPDFSFLLFLPGPLVVASRTGSIHHSGPPPASALIAQLWEEGCRLVLDAGAALPSCLALQGALKTNAE